MPWPSSLAAHAKCYVQDSDEESWKAPHATVMKNHDEADALREAAAFGVFLLGRIRSLPPAKTFEESLALYRGYISWHSRTQKLLEQICASEKRDFAVDGADRLRSDFESVNAMIGIFQRRCELLEDGIKGKGVSLDEFAKKL